MVQINRYNPSYWPRNQVGYNFAVKKQVVAKKNHADPASLPPSIAHKTDMDRLRLRMARLERRVNSLDSTFTICFLALATIGIGIAAHRNWETIQEATNTARSKMYSWDEIKDGGKKAWGSVSAFFSKSSIDEPGLSGQESPPPSAVSDSLKIPTQIPSTENGESLSDILSQGLKIDETSSL